MEINAQPSIGNHSRKSFELLHLEIRLKDGMDDSVIFRKLLGEIEMFTGSLDIGFFNFTLSKGHVEELLNVIRITTASNPEKAIQSRKD